MNSKKIVHIRIRILYLSQKSRSSMNYKSKIFNSIGHRRTSSQGTPTASGWCEEDCNLDHQHDDIKRLDNGK